MKKAHKDDLTRLEKSLTDFDQTVEPLLGIRRAGRVGALARQLVDSVRRVTFVSTILRRPLDPIRADASRPEFDPIRAAALHSRRGDVNEAIWLVFMATHFGRNKRTHWKLVRRIYGGGDQPWTWTRLSTGVAEFRDWLSANQQAFAGLPFGNHRKYESLNARSAGGTGTVVESYVRWVQAHGDHNGLLANAQKTAGAGPAARFQYLYESMASVKRFGRTARFDFLTMLGKLNLAAIAPGSAFLKGATGPYRGANLLIADAADAGLDRAALDQKLVRLASHLGVGMQEIEDSLCNWQKSPDQYRPFRG